MTRTFYPDVALSADELEALRVEARRAGLRVLSWDSYDNGMQLLYLSLNGTVHRIASVAQYRDLTTPRQLRFEGLV